MAVRHYRELVVWQKAMEMAVAVYNLTRKFPREEVYGLASQMRRAAVSIPSNIAEGQGRGAGNEFAHYLRIARSSIQELETQLILAGRLEYITASEVERALADADETSRLVLGLYRSLE
jgi:four helix bundle protein